MTHLELRNKMKKKQPKFIKQMGRQKTRLKNKWRKPRGSDSKIKVGKKGYPKKIKVGFKGPKDTKGLSRKGFNIIIIKNISELKDINKEKDVVCLSKIGNKKKIDIIKKCIELKLEILNLRDPSKYIKDVEENLTKKKEDKKKKAEEKAKKSSKKEDKKKEGIESKVEEDENKDKKEKDKLLTKREI
jgi:large subunit ribosomal protein L32e